MRKTRLLREPLSLVSTRDGCVYTFYFASRLLAFTSAEALQKFDCIHRLVDELAPDRCELARTADDVRRIKADGKRVILIGVENGAQAHNWLELQQPHLLMFSLFFVCLFGPVSPLSSLNVLLMFHRLLDRRGHPECKKILRSWWPLHVAGAQRPQPSCRLTHRRKRWFLPKQRNVGEDHNRNVLLLAFASAVPGWRGTPTACVLFT